MSVPTDTSPKFENYANPHMLVSTDWVAQNLDNPDVVIVESDEDVLLYDSGHIPGAVKVDWHTELNDTLTRDYVDGEAFAALMSAKGIARDTTVVFYGDKSNWWAAYALWVFSLFGHPDVRLMDGGRGKWEAEGRPMTREKPTVTTTEYPVIERNDAPIRATRQDVEAHLGDISSSGSIWAKARMIAASTADQFSTSALLPRENPTMMSTATGTPGRLVDVRSPQEFSGEKLHMPDYPQEGAMRGGHIPGANSVPWSRAAADDGTFLPADQLRAIYETEQGLSPDDDVIAYCRIGERSSHTWFVLTHLLGYDKVRNYDGSWTEWGNLVGAPIEK